MPERISERKLDGDLQQFTIGLKPNFGDINAQLPTLFVSQVGIELRSTSAAIVDGDDRHLDVRVRVCLPAPRGIDGGANFPEGLGDDHFSWFEVK